MEEASQPLPSFQQPTGQLGLSWLQIIVVCSLSSWDGRLQKSRLLKSNTQYWCQVALHPDEITQMPGDIIHQQKKENEELIGKNQELPNKKEGTKIIEHCQ